MVTARHFGITEDRAVRYHADHAGTQLNYEVISEAVCNVREARPLNRNWKARIEEDFCQRKQRAGQERFRHMAVAISTGS